MFCRFCGNTIGDQAKFCNKCGQVVVKPPVDPEAQPMSEQSPVINDALVTPELVEQPVQQTNFAGYQQPYQQANQQANQQPYQQANQQFYQQPMQQPSQPQMAPQYAAMPAYQQAPPGYPPQPPVQPKRKRHTGCIVLVVLFLTIIGVLGFIVYNTFFGGPKDLGIRYKQADFDSAMAKTGLKVDFLGMNADQVTAYIKANRESKLNIDYYKWTFSDFQEKKFELTPTEATAFINEVAPLFSWFDDVQVANLGNNKAAGSYQVHFDKVKKELIADVANQIPAAISNLLPKTFNLYIVGAPFSITENELTMPAQLTELQVGPVSLRPVIGDTDAATRSIVMDYVERIYKQIPQLKIHSLKTNANNNFEFSGYIPTKVSITKK